VLKFAEMNGLNKNWSFLEHDRALFTIKGWTGFSRPGYSVASCRWRDSREECM
jgi:hypothetical protein